MKAENIKDHPFEVTIPNLAGDAIERTVTIQVPMEWDEEIREWLITPEGMKKIEDTKAREMGLILPEQMKELRLRLGFSQKKMGELFQVGEKSWTRWESGKHRPIRVISLLIRGVYEGKIPLSYLFEQAGMTQPQEPISAGSHWAQTGSEVDHLFPHSWMPFAVGKAFDEYFMVIQEATKPVQSLESSPQYARFTSQTAEKIIHANFGRVALTPSRQTDDLPLEILQG